MGASIYGNVGGAARKAKGLYGRVGGTSRKLKSVWADVGGVARKIYKSGPTWTYELNTNNLQNGDSAGIETGGQSGYATLYIRPTEKQGDRYIYAAFYFKEPVLFAAGRIAAMSIWGIDTDVRRAGGLTLYGKDNKQIGSASTYSDDRHTKAGYIDVDSSTYVYSATTDFGIEPLVDGIQCVGYLQAVLYPKDYPNIVLGSCGEL